MGNYETVRTAKILEADDFAIESITDSLLELEPQSRARLKLLMVFVVTLGLGCSTKPAAPDSGPPSPAAAKPPPPSPMEVGKQAWNSRLTAPDASAAVLSAMVAVKVAAGEHWSTIQEWPGGPTYGQLERNPAKYYGHPAKFSGRILEVYDRPDGTTFMRISTKSYGRNPIVTNFVPGQGGEILERGIKLGFAGYLTGAYSYTSRAGWRITVPSMLFVTGYRK